jgi:hypothetical protein
VPLIFIAILLVTVVKIEEETAVETSIFPVDAGAVIVLVPATAGTVTVTVPLVSPEMTIELIREPPNDYQKRL